MHVDKHQPGSFCWFELAITDQAGAKQFYQALFDWGVNDTPIGPAEFYSVFNLEGRDVAAAYTMRPEQRAQGLPPHWLLYLAVTDADATAKLAAELGGTVVLPPFDVVDLGRMTVIQDPTGAFFSAWQPKKNPGTGIAGVNHTVCWTDLSTPDTDGAAKFYTGLFGWKITAGKDMSPVGPDDYGHIVNGSEFIGAPASRPTASWHACALDDLRRGCRLCGFHRQSQDTGCGGSRGNDGGR